MTDEDNHCGTGAGCSEDSLCFCDCVICTGEEDSEGEEPSHGMGRIGV